MEGQDNGQDCNNTAGLEAVLRLAVGTRVMLRRNIDVKAGLVNSAIGNEVHSKCISIHLDRSACDIEQKFYGAEKLLLCIVHSSHSF